MKTSNIEATYIDSCGSDLSVVNAARVSFHKVSEEFKDGDAKLINYLAKHKHFSPFNHSFLSFRVKAPIFVARQLVKHKFMPWNEVSRRYVDDEPEFYMPGVGMWRKRAEDVKQGSGGFGAKINHHKPAEDLWGSVDNEYDPDLYVAVDVTSALYTYKQLLAGGVAPEQARMVLPQNMMTEWLWSGTLGAFADMLRLRLDPHTQYESRIVANLIYPEVEKRFPVSIKALLEIL